MGNATRVHSSMYAISKSRSIYHLLYNDQNYTLCGFRAKKFDSELPAKAALQVVETLPPNRELCKQCDKMRNRRGAVSPTKIVKSHNPEDSVIKAGLRSNDFFSRF
jgi:hypothetical protein